VPTTRSPAGIRYAVAVARDAGASLDRLLTGTGLSEAELMVAGYRIDQDAEFILTENLVREMGDAVAAGIAVGSRGTVGDLGIWGYVLISSATIAEALSVAVAYISLSPTLSAPEPIRSPDGTAVLLRYEHLPVDLRDYYAARDLSALPLLLRTAGLRETTLTLETRFVAEQGQCLAAAVHPIPVETGAAQHRIRVPDGGMFARLPTADPVTRAACARECERLVHVRAHRPTLSAAIRSRFAQTPDAMPGIDELAAELHMSPRTLRRQLEHEATSYRELRKDVSQTLAAELLGVVGLSVNEVARRLGYSDATAFSHAFRRWTGEPASGLRHTVGRERAP
jgi:AraC-like DNA-binding protein